MPLPSTAKTIWQAPVGGVLLCAATFVLAFGGATFGQTFVRHTSRVNNGQRGIVAALCQWDSQSYVKIAKDGYQYDPSQANAIVHYPAYPLAGRGLARLTGIHTDLALLIVSNLCFAAACAAVAARGSLGPVPHFAPIEEGHAAIGEEEARLNLGLFCALSLCLFPTTMFMRMAYSEGLFVCLAGVAVLGLRRRWPLWLVAAIVGLGTATRPVGAALLLPLLWRVRCDGGSVSRVLVRAALYGALASWGVAAYMLYQYWAFGDALAFVRNNEHWKAVPAIGWREHLVALVTLKPLWQVYLPSSPAYWLRIEQHPEAGFSLAFANPIYFVLALGMLIWGCKRRWIDTGELLLGLGLLAIPYVSKSYDMAFAGMGRFVASVVPLHFVFGHILARMPGPLAATVAALSAGLLAAYAALFAAGYTII
ncbi:MAG: hypothetical protein AB7O62_06645 [Pirellulales bacterium]